MKKFATVILIAIFATCLVGCYPQQVVVGEMQTYQINTPVHSLDIEVNAGDFKVAIGETLEVKSNLKYLTVKETNGVLTIQDTFVGNGNYANAKLTLFVPNGTVFDEVEIDGGAGKLTIDSLFADNLELNLGAGDVTINYLEVLSHAEIDGGAGAITVSNGTLSNLSLDLGTGKLTLTATLLGASTISCGVGQCNLTLVGDKEDYSVDVQKGVGVLTVDGRVETNFESVGVGENHVSIDGGVGDINLSFTYN